MSSAFIPSLSTSDFTWHDNLGTIEVEAFMNAVKASLMKGGLDADIKRTAPPQWLSLSSARTGVRLDFKLTQAIFPYEYRPTELDFSERKDDYKNIVIRVGYSFPFTLISDIADKNFVLTGTLSEKRGEIIHRILMAGGTYQAGINSQTNYLIASPSVILGLEQSTKYNVAQSRKLPVINGEQFLRFLSQTS